MDSITQAPTTQSRYESRSNKYAKLPISQRWMYVLSLHLSGRPLDEIAEKTGYAVSTIRQILSNQKVNELRQMLLQDTQRDFEALFGPIVNKLREMLDKPDQCAEAIKLWVSLHGRNGNTAASRQQPTINVTAEDVVFQILNTNRVNPPHLPPSSDRGAQDG